ncbi:sulfur carrier protein ThiS [Actinokineospora cianjurensis]|uniref:Sulfur carrier protein n=1 Tax=Actinokineospora cianjurensis TaxID=585224 RepID=A0A421B5V9_9PSEU|nr:sulfur carrier protein ThiS [Actinokineospora cianjurensis]RLK59754.1 sulfur carrier protein [Actinokineospora cianjurensis]
MIVVVNGAERELADGVTVGELLVVLGVSGAGTAVAVDGEVVPRAVHASTVVRAGAVVEVLTAVQGG